MGYFSNLKRNLSMSDSFPINKNTSFNLPEVPKNISITNDGKANTQITVKNAEEKALLALAHPFHPVLGITSGVAIGYAIYKHRAKRSKKGLFIPILLGWLGGGIVGGLSGAISYNYVLAKG